MLQPSNSGTGVALKSADGFPPPDSRGQAFRGNDVAPAAAVGSAAAAGSATPVCANRACLRIEKPESMSACDSRFSNAVNLTGATDNRRDTGATVAPGLRMHYH